MIFVAAAGGVELLALVLWVVSLVDKINAERVTWIVIIPILLAVIPVATIKFGIDRARSAPFLPEQGGDCLLMVLIIANGLAMLAYGVVMTSGF